MLNNKLLNLILLLFALSIFIYFLGFPIFDISEIFSYGLMIYGIASFYISFGTNKKGQIFFGVILFLSGVLHYIKSNYEFKNESLLFLPSMLFIFAVAFLVLYFDNFINKAFLIVGSALLIISLTTIVLINQIKFAAFIGSLSSILFNYYPIFLILIGMNLILNRSD